jgi:hypothetical protein
MTRSTPTRPGLAPWLRALRDTWWIVLLLFAAIPVLVAVEAGSDTAGTYQATATVAGVDVEEPGPELSRTIVATFETSDVAEAIRESIPYGGDPRRPPDAVTVEPILDTVLVRVHGSDADPVVAAALANAGAEALVDELGELEGLGVFDVTDRARVPGRRAEAAGSATLVLIGLIAAAGLSVVVLLVRMSVRRPVLGVDDVEATVGSDWVANVVVPRGHVPGAPLPGLGRLRSLDASTIFLAGVGADEAQRVAVTGALARTHAEREPVTVVLVGEAGRLEPELPEEVTVVRRSVGDPGAFDLAAEGRCIIDFDSDDAMVDAAAPGEGSAFVVAVVGTRGTTESLRQLADQVDPDAGFGVVLLRTGRA